MEDTTALQHRRGQRFELVRLGEVLCDQPLGQPFLVSNRCLAQPQEAADSRTVVLDGATFPIVTQNRIGRDFELLGKVDDGGRGHLKARTRKAPSKLGILEEDGKAKTGVFGFLGSDQFTFTRLDGPVVYQLVGSPMALHNTSLGYPVIWSSCVLTWVRLTWV